MKEKLGKFVAIRTGKLDANASSENGKYPFFTCSIAPLKIDTYSYDCECVLVAGNGDLNVKYYKGKFDAYQRTYIIESSDKGILSVKYLYLFLEYYIEELRRLSVGGVIKYIRLSNLTDALINVPSWDIQKEITEKLEKLLNIISKRKEQLAKLDALAKSRFFEMFGDVVNNSKNLEISTLGRECVIVSGGTPSTGNEEYWNGNIKWITPAEIDEIDYIIFDTVRHITDKGKSAAHLELMPKGTVLLSSRAPIGKLAITGSEMTCNQGFKNLIPKDRITPIFLYYYLKGIIPEIQSLGRGATFKEVSKSIVANIKILVPSKREQIAFNSFIEQLDKSKFRMKKCLKLFTYMRHL